MMMNDCHDTSIVLNEKDVKNLNDHFTSFLNTPKMDEWDVHYNLCKVKRLVAHDKDQNLNLCVEKLRDYSKNFLIKRNIDHNQLASPRIFFLEYYPGSFTHIHQDNVKENGTSLITLIDQPSHTKGGEIIIEKPVLIKKGNIKRVESRNDVPLLSIETIPQRIGETSIYKSGVRHGVSRVTRGRRRVFVCWF